MFTVFLTATAAAVSALMGGLLLRPRKDSAPLRVPYGAVTVAVLASALAALGLWMI